MKKKWIYQIRGLAIIAVVLCHQQWVLHDTEVLQLFSLYGVTALVFLMGVTKAISLTNYYAVKKQDKPILYYSLKSMCPTLCAYLLATIFYLSLQIPMGGDYNILLSSLLSFSAASPLYFIRYYILLSLWAPVLFAIIKWGIVRHEKYILRTVLLFVFIWLIGYLSIDRIDILGQSYLFIYSVGLLLGQLDEHKVKNVYLIPSLMVMLFGLISAKNFYWARVEGVTAYSQGIDFLCPKLQMNPPNLSIIVYSLGVISVSYFIFIWCNKSNLIFLHFTGEFFNIVGKYSLDIFLWHLYIQIYLNKYFFTMPKNAVKWIIYYSCMIGIPILMRSLYNLIKSKVICVLKD